MARNNRKAEGTEVSPVAENIEEKIEETSEETVENAATTENVAEEQETVEILKKAIVTTPIRFKGERKEVGEIIEVTAEEFREISKLVTEFKE